MPCIQISFEERPVHKSDGESFSPDRLKDAILDSPVLDPDEKTLLAMFVKEGFHAVCEKKSLTLIARKMNRSLRTITRMIRAVVEKFNGFIVRRRLGFVSGYFFSRDFCLAAEAIVFRRKKNAEPSSSDRSQHRTARPALEPPTWLNNADRDDFVKSMREALRKAGIWLVNPGTT